MSPWSLLLGCIHMKNVNGRSALTYFLRKHILWGTEYGAVPCARCQQYVCVYVCMGGVRVCL